MTDPWEDWEHLLDGPEDPANWEGVPGRLVYMIEEYRLVPPKGYFEWVCMYKPDKFGDVLRYWRPQL